MYSPELLILRLFTKDREAFETYYDAIRSFKFDREVQTLLQCILKYYETYEHHMYIGEDELKSYYTAKYPVDRDKDIVYTIIENFYKIDVSDSVIKDIIRNMIEKDVSLSIIEKLTSVVTDHKYGTLPTIVDDLAKYETLLEKHEPENVFVSPDLGQLIEENRKSGTLQWRLNCLKQDLGSITGSTLGHVFARPETGKTSFIASEATYIARQLGDSENLLWCNNEEAQLKIVQRCYTSMLNTPIDTILNRLQEAKEKFLQMGGGKIKIYDNAYISTDVIKHLIRTYNPRVLIVDQGDKVVFPGSSKLEGTHKLKELYRIFREIAKEFNIHILTVGQASGEAEGKRWLQMTHMDNSKTGKPGEMDYIIGIGKTISEDTEDEIRYLNLCKNKLTGKHSHHTVKLETTIGRYCDI